MTAEQFVKYVVKHKFDLWCLHCGQWRKASDVGPCCTASQRSEMNTLHHLQAQADISARELVDLRPVDPADWRLLGPNNPGQE